MWAGVDDDGVQEAAPEPVGQPVQVLGVLVGDGGGQLDLDGQDATVVPDEYEVDLVVTVALGSTLATVLLSKDVPLLEGILAFALLICAQYIITALSVRSVAVRRFVKSEPRLLFHNGQMLQQALRRERVTENEILAVARASGYADMAKVGAVILETDGSFDVIGVIDAVEQSSLKDVKGH